MKYSVGNPPAQCFMRQSTWYRNSGYMATIKGVLVHSTGANNPNIKRYVQPDDNAADRDYWLRRLGENQYHNDWNHIDYSAGVHAFIGRMSNGAVSTVQVGEWQKTPWGCYKGVNGSCNNGWIQFEICEDALNDAAYFDRIYAEATELTAYLCILFNLDPLGTTKVNGVTVPVILCHQDSYRLGLGSNHADVLHWFPKFGKSMEDFRNDVAEIIKEELEKEEGQKEEEELLTLEQFKKLFEEYRKELQDNDCSEWSKEGRKFCIDTGIITGGGVDSEGNPNYMFGDFVTREQLMVVIYRLSQLMARLIATTNNKKEE